MLTSRYVTCEQKTMKSEKEKNKQRARDNIQILTETNHAYSNKFYVVLLWHTTRVFLSTISTNIWSGRQAWLDIFHLSIVVYNAICVVYLSFKSSSKCFFFIFWTSHPRVHVKRYVTVTRADIVFDPNRHRTSKNSIFRHKYRKGSDVVL